MRKVVYSMFTSLDGYIVGPDGSFDWSTPDDEVFKAAIDEIEEADAHLLGRGLYETMLYWETADEDPDIDEATKRWTALWKALPKVVFSRTLTEVEGTNTRLATDGLAEEIARLRAEPGDGDIAIGGATLGVAAAELDLIDEYRARIFPVLVGGGIRFFPETKREVGLELLETRTFASQVVSVSYRVVR
jgi:dihydrofolate reductase